jgi:hypothetical protein
MVLALAFVACADVRDDEDDAAGTGSAGDADETSDAASAPTASAGDDDDGAVDSTGSDDEGMTKLDVGPGEGSADDGGMSDECENVDVLFVIDDSASMADNQESLIASFDGFVQGMQTNLQFAQSYHIGIVTSDSYYVNAPGCTNIGDLVTRTGGLESSAMNCEPFASGARYLDESEPDLAGKFACAAQVGSGGNDDEMVMRGLLNAMNPATACNEGFARDDSLLVIVIISDEDDVPEPYMCDPDDPFDNPCMTTGSGGTPDEWVAELGTYKSNIDTNVVVLSLVGLQLDNSCGAVPASKLIGFANRFGDNGFTDDVCAESYDEFFAAALPIIDGACQDYVPPAG